MTVFPTPEQIAQELVDAGFTGWEVVTMGAIAVPESLRDDHAYHLNTDPDRPWYLTFDLGLFQINEAWFPYLVGRFILLDDRPYTPQLMDLATNIACARDIYLAGSKNGLYPVMGYRYWNTYKAGLHIPYLHEARMAARAVGVPV